MVQLYSSMIKGLTEDKEALAIFKKSGLFDGIETIELSERTIGQIKDAGLKYSIHDPHIDGMNNLANPGIRDLYQSIRNSRKLDIIREADAPTVGFHCGFSAKKVYKMKAFADVPYLNSFYSNEQELMSVISENLSFIENTINFQLDESQQKRILIEPMDYIRKQSQPLWDIQSEEVIRNRAEIETVIDEFGVNAAYRFVTEPLFFSKVLKTFPENYLLQPGFLFDVSHCYISADTKIHEGSYKGSIENYFEDIVSSIQNRTYQIHLNVPGGDRTMGFLDQHKPFMKNDRLSEQIMELTKYVIQNSPLLQVLTLEVSGNKNANPVEFTCMMIEQEEFINQLNIR